MFKMDFPKKPQVCIFNDNNYGDGIKSLHYIPKNNLITIYGCKKSTNLYTNSTMTINIDGHIYDGIKDKTNLFELGQFANDASFTDQVKKYLLEGDIENAQILYTNNNNKFTNCTTFVQNKKLYLISTKEINKNYGIYMTYGIAYWINVLSRTNKSIIKFYDKFNEYSLLHPELQFQIFYNSSIKRTSDLILGSTTISKNKIFLVKNNYILSNSYCLGILCDLLQIHVIYPSVDLLPDWIRNSPYNVLLYWKLIMDVIPLNIKYNFIKHYNDTSKDISKEKVIMYNLYKYYANKFIFHNKNNIEDFVDIDLFFEYFDNFIKLESILNKNSFITRSKN